MEFRDRPIERKSNVKTNPVISRMTIETNSPTWVGDEVDRQLIFVHVVKDEWSDEEERG